MRSIIMVLVVAAFSGSALAAPVEHVSGDVILPGGVAGLARVLGLEPSFERASAAAEFTRLIHSVEEGKNPETDVRLRELEAYLTTVIQFQASLDRLGASARGISLEKAADRDERRRLEGFVDLIGLRLRRKGRTFVVEPRSDKEDAQRSALLTSIGVNLADVASRLNAGGTIRLAIPSETVPIPLPRSVWESVIFERKTPHLLLAILADRRAALLCHGLAALDDETLAYVGANSELLRRLYSDHSGAFAAFGASVRIRNGRVAAPGGPAGTKIWEALLDESVERPDRFIRELFSRAFTAYIYDLAGSVDGPHQAFVLGTWMPEQRQSVSRLRQLIDVASATSVQWDVEKRPFARPPDDVVTIVTSMRVDTDGRPQPPNTRRFWERALDAIDLPDNAERDLHDADADLIDGAWIAERLLVEKLEDRRRRVSQFVFGQRLSESAGHRQLPEILVAVRAIPRYRALMLTLERIGIREPLAFSRAARTAQSIGALGKDRQVVALKQLQGTLSLIDALRRPKAISDEAVHSIVTALFQVPLGERGYAGGLLTWISDVLAPALKIDAASERRLIERAAGTGHAANGRRVSWEGESYSVDLSRGEVERVLRIRAQQAEPSLDTAVRLARIAKSLAGAITLEDARRFSDELSAIARILVPVEVTKTELPDGIERFDPRPDLDETARNLSRIRQLRDLNRESSNAQRVLDVADWAAGEALASMAFAFELRDSKTALLPKNLGTRHDFGLGEADEQLRLRLPWSDAIVDIVPGQPWRTRGSLLALDIALGHLGLRRTAAAAEPSRVLGDNERSTFRRSFGAMNAFALGDAAQSGLAAAERRGRARVAALAASSPQFSEIVDEIQMDGWRRRAVQWSLANDPAAVPGYFTMTDYARLGGAHVVPEWSGLGMIDADCYCLRLPARLEYWAVTGREQRGIVAAQVSDLNLHVAVTLERLGLPASLTKAVLTTILQDYLDRIRPTDANDWHTLVRAAQRVPQEEIEDVIAALTVNGPLYPSAAPAP